MQQNCCLTFESLIKPKTTLKVLHILTSHNWNTGQCSLILSTHCNCLVLSLFWSGHMVWSKYCSPPWATFQHSAMGKLKMYGIESHLWTILFRMIASCMYVNFGLLCNVPWCKQGNSLDFCWLLRPLHQEQPTSVRSLLLPSQDCRLIGLPSSPFRALHHSELPYTTVILASGPRKCNTFSWSTVKQITYHNEHNVSRVSKYSYTV